MSPIPLLVFFSLAGFFDSLYLWMQHLQNKPLMCPLGHNCTTVTRSEWGELLGVRNELLGMLYYSALFVVFCFSLLLPIYNISLSYLSFGMASVGLFVSAFLVYIQAAVIKNYCIYCLVSALLSVLIFIGTTIQFFSL